MIKDCPNVDIPSRYVGRLASQICKTPPSTNRTRVLVILELSRMRTALNIKSKRKAVDSLMKRIRR